MKPSDKIWWYVETQGVTLCRRDAGAPLSLFYPYAGLWTLIVSGNYNRAEADELMSVLMSADKDEAAHEVANTIAEWTTLGLLVED